MHSFLLFVLFTCLFAACNGQNVNRKEYQPKTAKEPSPKESATANNNIKIQVPDFDDPALQQFYEELTNNIKKTVKAIRNKDEAALRNLYKESEKMREKENQIMANAKHSPEDIKKKREWNRQVMPYYQEMHESDFFNKLEQKQR